MSATSSPLLSAPLARTLAWRDGQPVSAAQFLAEAAALAEQLPAQGQAVNLCQDRYLFALALAAALLRGHLSLLPPNALPQTLNQLDCRAAPLYALVDEARQDTADLPRIVVTRPASTEPATQIPQLPDQAWAACLLTSGSTGTPQPQHKRWGPLHLNIGAEAQRLAELMDRPSIQGLNIVATVPAQHSYGFESTVLLALLGGAAFDSGRPFYPADIADALRRLPRPRALVTTPFHLKTLLLAGVELPPVDLLLSATAPLSPQLAQQAEDRMQGRMVEIYGCTEAGQVAARRTTAGEIWTTLGRLQLTREDGVDGERFLVAGGHVHEPTPLADTLELLDARRFRLLGRANDIIHVAGKRSSLAHLNFHLNRIAGVDDGAFWLPPDMPEAVQRPIAFVVAPTLDARQIIAALRRQLEAAFVPRRVIHVDALPREATGKLTAQRLQEFALQTLAQHGLDPAGAAVQAPARAFVTRRIAADHPAFDGHFPGAPVLPGAYLLALVLQAVAEQPSLSARLGNRPEVQQVKFLAPLGPGHPIDIELKPQGQGLAFEVRSAGTPVARGQIAPAASA